jgi:hypothetical protein
MAREQVLQLVERIVIEVPSPGSVKLPPDYLIPTFNAIADENPDGVVMDGAV